MVVALLETELPLGLWSVTRFDGERQIHLTTSAPGYEIGVGDAVPWDETLCERMVAGVGPPIAPRARDVPAYADRADALDLAVGTYVGLPIRRADGALFGTLCGIDPAASAADLVAQRPWLETLVGLLGIVLEADVARSDLASALERAELLATSDELTGLHNRRGWERFLDHEEERHRRFGDPATVIVLDLDELKEVNDRDGHEAGDQLLCRTAEVLAGAVRSSDFLARLGGDEFGLVADRATGAEAAGLVRRLRRALDGAGVAASLGSASYERTDGLRGAWQRADEAMYAAKARRKGARPEGVRADPGDDPVTP